MRAVDAPNAMNPAFDGETRPLSWMWTRWFSSVAEALNELPVFANNAAALAAGRRPGSFYRSGGDPDVVCVVHE